MILPDNGRYRANKYKQAEYPLPPEVIDDFDNSLLSFREICLKHGYGQKSLAGVLRDHYEYDLPKRAADIAKRRREKGHKERREAIKTANRDAVLHALDHTTLSTAEIAKELKIPLKALYDILRDLNYDTEARGQRIRIQRAGLERKPDPMDAPMCSISREWLGKPWRTTP